LRKNVLTSIDFPFFSSIIKSIKISFIEEKTMANNSSVCGQVGVFISEKSQERNSFKDKVKLLTLLQNILEDLNYHIKP
jgi:hypothetical protein